MPAHTLFGSPPLRRWKPHGQCAVCRSWDAQALCRNCVERAHTALEGRWVTHAGDGNDLRRLHA